MTVSDEQFQKLLRHHLDGTATDEQFDELNTAMQNSPDRVREYVEMREVDNLLEWELGFPIVDLSIPELQKKERKITGWQPLAIAAGIAVAFLVGTLVGSRPDSTAKPQAAAVLFDSEDAVWMEKSESRNFGAPFRKGKTYQLDSGVARLAFANGAGLAIEGPARMTVVNADRVEILEGKIAAYVPDEAVGFVVATPGMNIVDLGTKFGVEIKPNGERKVHVFEGQVEVEQTGSTGRRLIEAGEGLHYQSGVPTSIAAREEDFAEPPSLEQLLSIGGAKEVKKSRPQRTTFSTIKNKTDLLALEDFSIPPGEIDGQTGAFGFGKHKWKASRLHTQIVRRVGEPGGGRLLIRGRQVSEPNVVNRLSIGLEKPLPKDFYIAVTGRYEGLDDDDFFCLWTDSIDRQDSSHSIAPNMGIRYGNFFARIGLEQIAIGPLATDGETFTLLMKVERNPSEGVATVKFWNENFDQKPAAEITAPCEWTEKVFKHIGIRLGKDSDVSDKLMIDQIIVGTSPDLLSVSPVRSTSAQGTLADNWHFTTLPK